MYVAHIEANMLDDDTADFLSTDSGWLEAQWPECRRQAQEAGKTVTGNPELSGFTRGEETDDGYLYDFSFNVPTN